MVPLPLPLPYLYILYHFLPRGQGASSTLDLGIATSPPLLRANLLELLIQSAKRTPWNTAIAETNDTCFGLKHVKIKCWSEFASTVRKRENGLSRLPLHTWQSYCAGCFIFYMFLSPLKVKSRLHPCNFHINTECDDEEICTNRFHWTNCDRLTVPFVHGQLRLNYSQMFSSAAVTSKEHLAR